MVYPVNWGQNWGGIHKSTRMQKREDKRLILESWPLGWCLAPCGPHAMFFLVS